MSNTSLTPELVKLTTELAAAFAQSQKVISAKARIGLFYQNPEATDLFRKVNEYGEKLRNKHMEGMPPSEEEISAMLCDVGLDEAEFRAMYSEGKLADAVKYAKDLKDRYTVLWLYNSIRR